MKTTDLFENTVSTGAISRHTSSVIRRVKRNPDKTNVDVDREDEEQSQGEYAYDSGNKKVIKEFSFTDDNGNDYMVCVKYKEQEKEICPYIYRVPYDEETDFEFMDRDQWKDYMLKDERFVDEGYRRMIYTRIVQGINQMASRYSEENGVLPDVSIEPINGKTFGQFSVMNIDLKNFIKKNIPFIRN